jgi:HAD superfamily hydrolase (TIGR01509 family)
MLPAASLARWPAAVLFDMDGTLTAPLIDFDAIRRDMGIGPGPILEAMDRMSASDRATADAVLFRHEADAAERSTLNPGCRELLAWLAEVDMPVALVTRNTRRSVETVLRLHRLHIDVCVTREDGRFKPDPAPLRLACERLGVVPATAWMVGDGYHDIEAGLAAGMPTVWVSHRQRRGFAAEPTVAVDGLPDLHEHLRRLHTRGT